MPDHSDKKIIDSWNKNAKPWTDAVRNGEISSRVDVTNDAVIQAILDQRTTKVIDIGCGEGWLVRTLVEKGIDGLGIDVVPELIGKAEVEGIGQYRVLSYEDLSFKTLGERFETAVCNFSLIGKESVEHVFRQMPLILMPGGKLIIQTLNPANVEDNEMEGWRDGSWDGFSDRFTDPAPWYFRGIESWKALFFANGFESVEMREPHLPDSKVPASLILIGTCTLD